MVVSVVVVAVAVCEPACQLAWRLNEEEGGGEISSSLARSLACIVVVVVGVEPLPFTCA